MSSATRSGRIASPGIGAGRFCSQNGSRPRPASGAWTFTPKLFTSSATACVRPMTPNFEAQYSGCRRPAPAAPAPCDKAFTIRPQ